VHEWLAQVVNPCNLVETVVERDLGGQAQTVRPAMAAPLLSLQRALGDRAKRLILVHRKSDASVSTTAIAPGVEALDVGQLMTDLN
jgi:hypothetical protein